VTGIRRDAKGLVTGVETTKGFIGCKKLGLAAAGNSTTVAKMAGLSCPSIHTCCRRSSRKG
jgi:glycine/D-amino acid oxidase-like deaminating enzyme